MIANEERVRLLITQQASDWFIANRSGLNRKEQSAFAAWLQASPVHVREYLSVAAIVGDFRAACADSVESLDEIVARARLETDAPAEPFRPAKARPSQTRPDRQRWRMLAPALAVVSLFAIGLAALWSLKIAVPGMQTSPAPELHFVSGHGEQQAHTLPDRSVVRLNTDTAVGIRYDRNQRLVTLANGEAFFEVAHEPHRAFRVLAGPARIVAVGTQFDVRLTEHAATISVLQGVVTVGPSDSNASFRQPVPVAAGEQIRIADDQQPAMPVPADTKRTAAWLHRQIVFDHEPLQRVAAELNRYTARRIEIVTPALQDLEISGVFATDNSDAFIAFLRSLDGVLVEVTPEHIRVSQREGDHP